MAGRFFRFYRQPFLNKERQGTMIDTERLLIVEAVESEIDTIKEIESQTHKFRVNKGD